MEDLVFLDETGPHIALTPLYARAPKGERARAKVPRNRGMSTTLIAALSLTGMGAAMILEGSTNTTAFEVSIEQVLVPTVQPGQIVIMDNLRAQKCTGQASDRGKRLSTPLFTELFTRPFPHRRSLFQTQSHLTPSRSLNQRSLGRGSCSCVMHYHPPGCVRMVPALWIFPQQ
jgi:hypothetical protein